MNILISLLVGYVLGKTLEVRFFKPYLIVDNTKKKTSTSKKE